MQPTYPQVQPDGSTTVTFTPAPAATDFYVWMGRRPPGPKRNWTKEQREQEKVRKAQARLDSLSQPWHGKHGHAKLGGR